MAVKLDTTGSLERNLNDRIILTDDVWKLLLLVGGGEEVEHGGDPQRDPGRLRVPLYPEGDEGGGDQDHSFGRMEMEY